MLGAPTWEAQLLAQAGPLTPMVLGRPRAESPLRPLSPDGCWLTLERTDKLGLAPCTEENSKPAFYKVNQLIT